MREYFIKSEDQLLTATFEHVSLTLNALFLSILLAGIFTLLLLYFPRWKILLVYTLSLVYAIPSFALFAIFIPLTGLGKQTAIVVLVVYAQYILVRSFIIGIDKVDSNIVEAARGMGMDFWQVLFHIQLPLASKSLFSAVRLATISIVAISTIAATINAGGLGTILFDGLRTMNVVKLVWGISLSIGVSLFFSFLLSLIENIFEKN